MSIPTGGRHRHLGSALQAAYRYGGPLNHGRDVAGRRRRIAQLIRGIRRGWKPKEGLQRARSRGAAFVAERRQRLLDTVRLAGRS